MSLSTTNIVGFGIDLSDKYNDVFNDFFNKYFDNSAHDGDDDFAEKIIALWYMQKNDYIIPTGEYIDRYDSMSSEWKNYHRCVTSESRSFNISLNVYGHCYRDSGKYLLAINESLTEREKINKSDFEKKLSQEALDDLDEFIRFFNLGKPDWHTVMLTC